MAFVVKQKIKGKTYLYEAVSIWDKEKKRSYQKRKYIGRDPDDKKAERNLTYKDISTKNYGNVFLVEHISRKLGLPALLKKLFPEYYNEILWLSYFDLCASEPSYMFHHWLDDQYHPNVKKLNSSRISELHDYLGKNDGDRLEFIDRWIDVVRPESAIYYDVTSISSYSRDIENVEWGYNRDGENLPQINMGVVFSKNTPLPVYYNSYQGSVTDVSTLKNCLKYLKTQK